VQRLPRYRTGDADLDDAVGQLVDRIGTTKDADLVFEIIVSAARLARDRADRGDLKIANAALKELRYAFSVFAPYRWARKAAIFGSARTQPVDPLYRQTVSLARELAAAEWMVITGAGPGIMEAGIEGAGVENSFGVGIQLPFEAATTQFLADDPKLTFVKEADGFVLLPGGFGTLDEAFELLTLVQTGKAQINPIVLLDVPGGTYWHRWLEFISAELGARSYISPGDTTLFRITDDTSVALDELTGFYTNYHSQRYVDGELVLRLQHEPEPGLLDRINAEFADIVLRGRIERIDATRIEVAERDVPDLPRLRFRFDRHNYARLRALIDTINGRN
jgi:uncharacterized protein (TIGR00730 family)